MNVYDFDNTIYDGDSTLDFYFYCLKKHPSIFLMFPKQLLGFLYYKKGKINKTEFKSIFFSFLKRIKNLDEDIKAFWDINQAKIKSWYTLKKDKNDVIISASPEFLLTEICCRLNITHLIASVVDLKTGKFLRPNCYGAEKVNRFLQEYPNAYIDEFYTDSTSDTPMISLASTAYMVKKNNVCKVKQC